MSKVLEIDTTKFRAKCYALLRTCKHDGTTRW